MNITIPETGYVNLLKAMLLTQYNEVISIDIIKEKIELLKNKKSPIAERWVAVSGFATVHLDGNEHTLKANDSIYIQVGAIHSLANNTSAPLHLLELQSGSYLGEDDIERLEDLYGRC
jgi:mannose-6-phosphate isomerase-like protein (cupin superfamily)